MTSRPQDIQQITGARKSLSEDIKGRQTRYLISMAVRTACFLLAIVTTGTLRWIFFTGSLLLPYLAVVIANGGRESAQEVPRIQGPELVGIEPPPSMRAPLRYEDDTTPPPITTAIGR